MEKKKDIRKQILKIRDELVTEELARRSEKITKLVCNTQAYKEAGTILLYADYHNEVSTDQLFQDAISKGKKVFYPKVFGQEMEFYHVKDLSELKFGYKGIREPQENPIKRFFYKKQDNTLMIVPGVAFDTSGFRIGYGKGYYDKYLCNRGMIAKFALAFDFQILEKIPAEECDVKMDKVITEELIYSFLRV